MSKELEWKAHYEEIKDELDPGIRDYVKVLMENGVRSFSSCEGGKAEGNTHFWHEPTICFHGGIVDLRVEHRTRSSAEWPLLASHVHPES